MKYRWETVHIFDRNIRLAETHRRAALATVIQIQDVAYRRPRARLLIEEDGSEQIAESIVAELPAARCERTPTHLRSRAGVAHAE